MNCSPPISGTQKLGQNSTLTQTRDLCFSSSESSQTRPRSELHCKLKCEPPSTKAVRNRAAKKSASAPALHSPLCCPARKPALAVAARYEVEAVLLRRVGLTIVSPHGKRSWICWRCTASLMSHRRAQEIKSRKVHQVVAIYLRC